LKASSSMTCTGDAAQVLALIEQARELGIELTRVSCGTCSVEVASSRPAGKPIEDAIRRPHNGLYSQLGGDLFKEAIERGDIDPGQLEPVVGRR